MVMFRALSSNPLSPEQTAGSARGLRAHSGRLRKSRTLTRVDVYVCYPYTVSMETSMSTTAAAVRVDRIELRATREERRLLAAAAAHERLDVTSFILRNVLPAARDIVDRSERIRLSERDAARVLDLLENPPEPTAVLLAAARRRAART